MVSIGLIFALLIVFQLKHFAADYPLQRPWMLGKFKPGLGFIPPLAAHCLVHAIGTLLIASCVRPDAAWACAGIDFAFHFTMDRVKASPRLMGRWKPLTADDYASATKYAKLDVPQAKRDLRDNRMFWNALGIDQAFHHLTHYLIVWLLVH